MTESARQRLDSAMLAGLGSGFTYILYEAAVRFAHEPWRQRAYSLAAIGLVALGIIAFLEPLLGRLREGLGAGAEHGPVSRKGRRRLRLAVFVVLSFTSVAHAFLHEEINRDLESAFITVGWFFLVPGGITWAWLAAVGAPIRVAGLVGALAGAVLGFCNTPFLYALFLAPQFVIEPDMARTMLDIVTGELAQGIARSMKRDVLLWGLIGLGGGLALDLRGARTSRWLLAPCPLATALLVDAAVLAFGHAPAYDLRTLIVLGGWGLGLIAYPGVDSLLVTASSGAARAR